MHSSAEDVARLAIQDANAGDNARIDLILPDNLSATPVEMPVGLAVAALRNLLDNALRHTPADTRVELRVLIEADNVVFRVRDHGQQISPEDLQYLTQRFWRNGSSEGWPGLGEYPAGAVCVLAGLDVGTVGVDALGKNPGPKPDHAVFQPAAAD